MLLPKQSRNCVTGLAAACSLLLIACSPEEVRQVNLIPKPEQMTMTGGTFTVDSLALFGGQSSRNIKTVIDEAWSGNPEGYQLDVTPGGIDLRAGSPDGLFYGMQTLRQLYAGGEVPCVSIRDNPRFGYRGLHLDVSRHFFSKEEVMKLLDVMSFYKLNTLHMHLTDAGGWRIEIDKYPKLTSETAFRTESDWRKWWDGRDRKYLPEGTPGAYGGYYTKEDIREIVKHAASKHINIIPEIEFPGHSEEVLMAYPELSCSGKPYQNGDFCIGNEQSFTFMEDVLAEVIDLFPSEYIHVGGDEAGKSAWKKCPKCQALMTEKGMKSVDELQSYMIHRAEEFLNSKDRRLIGWDEILEGGLAPEATVMSWRGEEGGIAAVTSGHHAIMTPGAYCYLDSYQDAPYSQPEAIGGYLPLKKVYAYDPVPASLTAEQAKLVYGVQGNLWVEYIPTPEHVEYMIYPRMLALAEVAWSAPERKSWSDFHTRALSAVADLQKKGYHPFDLSKEIGSRPESLQPVSHLALGKKVTYNSSYSPHYPAQGNTALTDGIRGDWTYGDGSWQGFISDNRLDVTIDMEKETPIHSVTAAFMQVVGAEVFLPETVIISISDDGINFTELQKQHFEVSKETPIRFTDISWQGEAKGRYVRYQAQAGSEFGGWIFTDEIIVK